MRERKERERKGGDEGKERKGGRDKGRERKRGFFNEISTV